MKTRCIFIWMTTYHHSAVAAPPGQRTASRTIEIKGYLFVKGFHHKTGFFVWIAPTLLSSLRADACYFCR